MIRKSLIFMRVLHIVDINGIGGLQNWVLGIAKAQQQMDHEVTIILPPDTSNWSLHTDIPEIPIKMWDLICFQNADIVHSHAGFGAWNSLIKKQYPRLPIVHTYYGASVALLLALGRYLNVGWYLDLWRRREVLWKEAIGGRWVDCIIAVSKRAMKEVCLFYRIPVSKITVIHGGYWKHEVGGSKTELRRKLGLPEYEKLILFVGRPDPVKAFESLLKCFRKLRQERKDVILITAPLQEIKAQDGIIGVELPWHRMPELYCACDMLVSCSKYEGYSLAIHEAMAYGLPVIIPDCVGILDLCVPNENAIVLPRWNHFEEQLLGAIKRLLDDDPLRLHLGQNARATMEYRTWDWVARETEKVYVKAFEKVKTL
jgi:D-inositol-3-phosphate glycosyltransferase